MNEAWKDNFKSASIRVGFRMGLSRSMCEFLSAVADNVWWNRSSLGGASADPDNFLATGRALVSRGLIQLKPDHQKTFKSRASQTRYEMYSWMHYELTPAGIHVVELLKISGMFIEADMAIEKKIREKSR